MKRNTKWLSLFKDGVWTGREDRMVTIFEGSVGTEHNIDDLAEEYGIVLPDGGAKPKSKSKKTINRDTDVEEKRHEDLEESHEHGDFKLHDGGDSEG